MNKKTSLSKKLNIHLIGIGGIGMSGLAEYFLKFGNVVSGSDMMDSDIVERLKKLGAKIMIGHSSDNVNNLMDLVVYSSAVKEDNPELLKAKDMGLKTLKRAEMLGEIVNDKFLIAVAGTHGKTTTTAMIAKLLTDAGLDPMVFVGGNVSLFNGGASRFSNGDYAVVEADEYDRSFLTLKPDIIVITSIDEDHLDIYKDIDDIKNTFKQFCESSKLDSKIIYLGDDDNISSFIHYVKRNKYSYGFGNNNYLKVTDCEILGDSLYFSLVNSTALYKKIRLNMIGRHNVLNSTACFLSAKLLNLNFEIFKKSIAEFKTVDRRLQLKHHDNISVFDDYAHHPREIESSLKGLKEHFMKSRIICVFQPHLYSRTLDFYKEFASALGIADKVVLLDIYPAREKPMEGVTSELIFNELIKNEIETAMPSSKKEALKILKNDLKKNDVIVFQGAGDITLLCNDFIKELEKKNDIII